MSSQVRLRRLQADYEAVRALVHRHPRVEIEGVSGNPPERYRLLLKVRSLRQRGEDIEYAHEHRLEVRLPFGYPRDAPVCRMLTPVFHPNIAPHVVCIGDHWTAAESLATMIQRVGEMLAFQSYNIKSPLNGEAARWAEENLRKLPVDIGDFFMDLTNAPAAGRPPEHAGAPPRCHNCGAQTPALEDCKAAPPHRLCPDCVIHCETCNAVLCMQCGPVKCAACSGPDCSNCGAADARSHQCANGHDICEDCELRCHHCETSLCLVCGEPPCGACGSY